ncbi:MAG: VOC family protein [Oscillospiraceae bacterium]|nr:VOC family protein [Oscillospiraceae bacterium]
MKFKIDHNNINVSDLAASLTFYETTLGLTEQRRITGEGFTIVFLKNAESDHSIELTYLEGHPQKYDLGENEFHMAFRVDDFDAAYRFHKEQGCICYENAAMGIYFINDPDGYWLEILPPR